MSVFGSELYGDALYGGASSNGGGSSGYGYGPYGNGPYGSTTSNGSGSPGRIVWNQPNERTFESGLDRGVLYPQNAPAVPWNGLTAVDEAGGEGSVEYFIDGRPFLYFPIPKEYSATLKAYTYPDEFIPAMGMVESTDGMYLDSQLSETFDLSYRTLVGNLIEGATSGYKIHLVYNASVSSPSASYATMSENVNPMEFSWEIQAVPVSVTGYRPTAHITIDTRHMDSYHIAKIEALLYGDIENVAGMPSPQVIFDTLSFDDGIIITDNFDGTWTAEGSYLSIYMTGYGIFQIDNVDAVNHGDGTYTINSTAGTGPGPDPGSGTSTGDTISEPVNATI